MSAKPDFAKLEKALRGILQSLTFPSEERRWVEEHLDAGEYGLAFEVICETIEKHRLRIPAPTFRAMEDAGRQMQLDEKAWKSLSDLVLPGSG